MLIKRYFLGNWTYNRPLRGTDRKDKQASDTAVGARVIKEGSGKLVELTHLCINYDRRVSHIRSRMKLLTLNFVIDNINYIPVRRRKSVMLDD